MIDVLINGLIEQAASNMPPEAKAAIKRIDEFLPMVETYHQTAVPLNSEKNEVGVGYLIRFEKNKENKEQTDIVLYQVVLAAKEGVNNNMPTVSRSLNRWNVTEKLKEIAG